MTAVEFRAFGAYVHKVFRNDEANDGDPATNRPDRRARLWCKETPSTAGYHKTKTFLLDLSAHPGVPNPNFAGSAAGGLRCDSPGYTAIGAGTRTVLPFETSDDYVNRIYLTTTFWSTLGAHQPTFPPIAATPMAGRIVASAPQPYEFKSFVFPNDDSDVPRRNRRFLGYYAEVVSKVSGRKWNVRVFHWNDSSFEPYELDFGDPTKYHAAETTITETQGSAGALFLDSEEARVTVMDLPKLPPAQGAADIPTTRRAREQAERASVPPPDLLEVFAARPQ